MSESILINASQPEEIRVALVHGNKLYDLDIEYAGREQKKANIYKGKVVSVEPSLEAAFIDFGNGKNGFLPFKSITPQYTKQGDSQKIRNAREIEQELMVQIEKEERGNKGAVLTTYITLAGSYLVLMPNNPGAGGISRRIEGEERHSMHELLSQLGTPVDMGLILRTAGVGREISELETDLKLLLKQWDAIKKAFHERSAPCLIFQEGDVVSRSLRDYLRHDIDEIIIDDNVVFEKTKAYIEQIRPDFLSRLKLYQDLVPLFMHFGIEEAVESAFQREIRLSSGASIVIDCTEALVAIDINSGRSTRNEDIEETALKTNLEASEEIAHQLRIRDLGGLIVIDFIDMISEDNKRQVENRLREAVKKDRARIQIGRISQFGLLQMSRQRLRHSLGKANETLCPRCQGQRTIRSIESLVLSVIRAIEKEVLKKIIQPIKVEMSLDMLTYLVNEKRQAISRLEQRHRITIILIPNPHWETPHYQLSRLGTETLNQGATSLTLISNQVDQMKNLSKMLPSQESPAVQGVSVLPKVSTTLRNWLRNLISCFGRFVKPKSVASTLVALAEQPKKLKLPARQGYRGRSTHNIVTKNRKDYHNFKRGTGVEKARLVNVVNEQTVSPEQSSTRRRITKSPGTRTTRSVAEPKTPVTTSVFPAAAVIHPTSTQAPELIEGHVVGEKNVQDGEPTLTVTAVTQKRPRNVRRFGGAPKLRNRSYADNTESDKMKQ